MKKTIKKITASLLTLTLGLVLMLPIISYADTEERPVEFEKTIASQVEDKTLPFNGELDEIDSSGAFSSVIYSSAEEPSAEPKVQTDACILLSVTDNLQADSKEEKCDTDPTLPKLEGEKENPIANNEGAEATPKSAESVQNVSGKEKSTETNFFESLYGHISAHFGEIFSALSFAVGLIVAVGYKKNLLPSFKGATEAIEKSYEEMKKDGNASVTAVTDGYEVINRRMEGLEEAIRSLHASYSERLDAVLAAGGEEERRVIKEILLCQVDMLYNVFISSSLPQYQKESVGKSIEKMRQAVSKND